ncbi:glycosyltransferase family 4 protein [Thiotrichales bacterium 19X7-9]|nr:glycosyltransferase family 4 protein [Thiotrichales bacterium 19X7-9]
MKKILIIYNFILHYRVAFFNELGKYYDVTVLHSGKAVTTKSDRYKEVIFPVKKIGPFYFQSGVIRELKNKQYDVVIALFDVRWVNTIRAIYYCNDPCKFIWWGAWITKSKLANMIRYYFTKKSDANIYYTYEAKKNFLDKGITDKNLYVANNTFDVFPRVKCFENNIKNKILFVGSLDKRKQNDVLIDAFCNILSEIDNQIDLVLVGDGKELDNIKYLLRTKNILDRVVLVGKVNSADKLLDYYREAIISVSFGQAGLSVLQSLGFGVPFLTKRNAVSGGEKSNIKDQFNGILCDSSQESLEDALINVCNNIDWAKELGKNAYNYYSEYCTIENMVQGFCDAIEGTNVAKVDMSK